MIVVNQEETVMIVSAVLSLHQVGEDAMFLAGVGAVVVAGVKCSDYGTQHGKSKPSKGKTPVKKFQVHDLLDVDNDVPKTHDFRAAGACLPSGFSVEPSPADLFQLFFDNKIVQKICDATNEYAERQKTKRPTMHRYFKNMIPDDFYALMRVFIHLGYRRIPRYRLM